MINGCDGVNIKIKTVKDDFYKLEKGLRDVGGKSVNVGVLGGGEEAYLAGIHEYGCRIKVTDKMRAYLHRCGLHLKDSTKEIVIPERAFLRNGFDECHKEVIKKAEKALGAVLGGEMSEDQFFEMIGLLLKGKIQTYARNLKSPPNHPYTVDQKGTSNPLIDSGDMIGAITYEVR